MSTNITIEEIRKLVRAHWDLQMGTYFSELIRLDGAVYNLGALVKDYYWNYAGMIDVDEDKIEKLIGNVIHTAKERSLEPAFYIDPTTNPKSFTHHLISKGFQPDDDEIWMHCKNIEDVRCKDVSLEIKEVQSQDDMSIYIDVFNEAYEMLEGDDLTSTYSDSLLQAFNSPPKDVKIKHYLGFDNKGEVVGISSIYVKGNYAGLYNVAVLPNYRKNGFGGVLSTIAVKDGFLNGASVVLLQTDLNGDAHRLYSHLGFEDAFVGTIWAKE